MAKYLTEKEKIVEKAIDNMITEKDLNNMKIYCLCGHNKYRHLKGICYGAVKGACNCRKFMKK